MTWKRCGCEVKDISLVREGLSKLGKEMWSDIGVEYLIATVYNPFENLQVMDYVNWKMESQIYPKMYDFFSYLETRSQICLSEWKAWQCTFHSSQDCLSNVSQCIQLFAITCVSTVPHLLCVLVSAYRVLITHWFVATVSDGCVPRARQGRSVGQNHHRAGGGYIMGSPHMPTLAETQIEVSTYTRYNF